jgi:hypothetical protein
MRRGWRSLRLGEKDGGHINVNTIEWKWTRASLKDIPLRTGKVLLQFATIHTGILVDQFLITTVAEGKMLKDN